MAYTLHDEDGHLGHGPSINGLRELKAFAKKYMTASYTALPTLLDAGVSDKPAKLAIECRTLAKKAEKEAPAVSKSLEQLARDASRAKGIVILAA